MIIDWNKATNMLSHKYYIGIGVNLDNGLVTSDIPTPPGLGVDFNSFITRTESYDSFITRTEDYDSKIKS